MTSIFFAVGSPYASFPYLLCNEDEDADDEEEPVRLSQLSTTKAVEDALASLRQVASPEIVFHEVTLSDTEDDVEIIYLSPGLLSPGFPAISEVCLANHPFFYDNLEHNVFLQALSLGRGRGLL